MSGRTNDLPRHGHRLFNGGDGYRLSGGDYTVSSGADEVPAANDGVPTRDHPLSAADNAVSGRTDRLPAYRHRLFNGGDGYRVPGRNHAMSCGADQVSAADDGMSA